MTRMLKLWIGGGRCLHARPFNRRPSPQEYASNSKSFSQRFSARYADSDPARQQGDSPGPAARERRKAAAMMFCGLDFKSPKIDCRWNSAALCAFVCYPVELAFKSSFQDGRRARREASDHTGLGSPDARQPAINGRSGVDTAVL